jgi:hypothetical protein
MKFIIRRGKRYIDVQAGLYSVHLSRLLSPHVLRGRHPAETETLRNIPDLQDLKSYCLFSRNSYVCPIWIFIFETDQAQINSVELRAACRKTTIVLGHAVRHVLCSFHHSTDHGPAPLVQIGYRQDANQGWTLSFALSLITHSVSRPRFYKV